jgi:hypothetical protein
VQLYCAGVGHLIDSETIDAIDALALTDRVAIWLIF